MSVWAQTWTDSSRSESQIIFGVRTSITFGSGRGGSRERERERGKNKKKEREQENERERERDRKRDRGRPIKRSKWEVMVTFKTTARIRITLCYMARHVNDMLHS